MNSPTVPASRRHTSGSISAVAKMTVVPVPGLVHRHVVERPPAGGIHAVDRAPVAPAVTRLVIRHHDAHAVPRLERVHFLTLPFFGFSTWRSLSLLGADASLKRLTADAEGLGQLEQRKHGRPLASLLIIADGADAEAGPLRIPAHQPEVTSSSTLRDEKYLKWLTRSDNPSWLRPWRLASLHLSLARRVNRYPSSSTWHRRRCGLIPAPTSLPFMTVDSVSKARGWRQCRLVCGSTTPSMKEGGAWRAWERSSL